MQPGLKKHPDITGDNGLGRSRGGFGTKIHLATDGRGLLLNIVLSPGQAHESQFALRLLDGIGVQRQNGSMKRRGHAVLADKAYSGHAFRNGLKSKGIKTVIPRKSNEKMASDGRSQLDRDAYRNRNVVERCFGRLKEYRRIATRYDKTARNYLAMVKLDCIRRFTKGYAIKGRSLVQAWMSLRPLAPQTRGKKRWSRMKASL
ncbi:transposase (IS4 family) protein [Serratia sp. FS14]|nr:transposase (IS4 family) protein [Serratia sp. FS14]